MISVTTFSTGTVVTSSKKYLGLDLPWCEYLLFFILLYNMVCWESKLSHLIAMTLLVIQSL